MKLNKNVVVYEPVEIGKDPIIEDFVILGKPPTKAKNNKMKLVVGDFPVIRSGTIIYTGNTIGNHFQTGDNARIREKNRIGNNVSIGAGSIIERDCEIMDNVKIHSSCFIPEYTIIKKNAWIGPSVIMTNVLHPPCPAFKRYAPVKGKKCCHGPIVEENAVVGAGAVILPGIIIGESSLVGAGAVVTKDTPPNCLVAGNPAKVIKKIEEIDCPLGFYKQGEVYSWRKK
ncbi:transferase [Candidatus Bathyarchaeota archaeon]|nr:transferase [Candidatus Bathyarchaeota archaeon]